MAMDTSDIKGRDARDRIINTLGLGLTYPLRDLPVEHRTLISVDLPAEIDIPDAQTGVWYQLCDEDGNPMTLTDLEVEMVVEIQGKDDDGTLVAQRVNFKHPESDTTEGLVVVGSEVTLTGVVEAVGDDTLTVDKKTFAVTRETLFAATCVDVEDPLLVSPPVIEDITYTILAFRKDPNLGLDLETYLNHIVSLQAGVDPTLEVSFVPYEQQRVAEETPDQIFVNYWDSDAAQEKVQVKIYESQEGVTYQLFLEKTDQLCTDREEEDGLSGTLSGDKGDIVLETLTGFNEDLRLHVKAHRTTRPGTCAYLETTLTVNVRPDPAIDVSVEALIYDYHTKARLTLADAQDSVTYALYQRDLVEADYVPQGTAGALEIPTGDGHSVFVKAPETITDWEAPSDFAQVGLFVEEGGAVSITTGDLAEDTLFVVRATKIDNGASVPLDQVVTALVRPDPSVAVSVEAAVLDYNAEAKLSLSDFQASVTYALYQRDLVEADYVPQGTAGALEIPTGEGHSVFVKAPETVTDWDDPSGFVLVKDFTTALGKLTTDGLPEDAFFVVRATKNENGERLSLNQVFAVLVRPNTALGVSLEPAAEADDGSVVTLATTQRGVFYELLDTDDTPVGFPGYHYEDRWLERTRFELDFAVESQGDAVLLLPTGPLTEPTTFTIRATKITTTLTSTVEVQAGAG